MKVLILGAGKVGGSLATALVNNNYDISIVDQNINLLSELERARYYDCPWSCCT